MKKLFLSMVLPVLLSGCATVITSTKPVTNMKNRVCAIVPFENLTETPLAGKRVAAIAYGVLRSKGYKVVLFEKKPSPQELEKFPCVIEGFVNEWRYKVGIDGEPAVSVTYVVKDTIAHKNVSSGTLSATEWGNKSLGVLTQELFERAF